MPSSAIATISAAINGPESHANEKVSCCHRVLYCPLRAKLYALGEVALGELLACKGQCRLPRVNANNPRCWPGACCLDREPAGNGSSSRKSCVDERTASGSYRRRKTFNRPHSRDACESGHANRQEGRADRLPCVRVPGLSHPLGTNLQYWQQLRHAHPGSEP